MCSVMHGGCVLSDQSGLYRFQAPPGPEDVEEKGKTPVVSKVCAPPD